MEMTQQWHSAAEFFNMGGYGFFVWGSYAVALLVMVVEPLLARRRHRQALLAAAQAREDRDSDDFEKDNA